MGLIDNIRTLWAPKTLRYIDPWSFGGSFNFGGMSYPLGLNQTMPGAKQEEMDGTFRSYVQQAYKANGTVFACMYARQRLFVQARFKYRHLTAGRPGDLWGNDTLAILEKPWANATTGDLLGRALQHADIAGNGYIALRARDRLKVMRPDWVSIILDAPVEDLDAQIVGYSYKPGGTASSTPAVILPVEEVAHFAPIADPQANFRGMSWLSPIVREVMADSAARDHKLSFFENGATPNLVVKRDAELKKEDFQAWVAMMEAGHTGTANAYKTLYLTAGADATVIGANLRQLDFKLTQGAGETRIAAAAGVPPIIVGLSEGLQAATYSNYGQARRAFADLWARPMWQNIAGSLATIVPPPRGSELWYDARDIPFLAEDEKDRADIEQTKGATIRSLLDAGFEADAVIAAVDAGDMTLLKGKHTGLFSVQLQAPGSTKMPAGEVPGEVPVGGGTKPEVIPAGDISTKPLGNGKVPTPAK